MAHKQSIQLVNGFGSTILPETRSESLLRGIRARLSSLISFAALVVALLACPTNAGAQGLEIGGGWAHITGDSGLDGFNVSGAWWFSRHVTIAADYDDTWDNSRVGQFDLTTIGNITVKNHLQDILVGPRIFFPVEKMKEHHFEPFVEAQFGASDLHSSVLQVGMPTLSSSGSCFTWMLGGGADYRLTSKWSARFKLDFLRTHLGDEGQSRLRLGIGIAYTFGEKE
jgi:hypothetical protein